MSNGSAGFNVYGNVYGSGVGLPDPGTGRVNVICLVAINGEPVEGAAVTARVLDPNSAVAEDTTVASTGRQTKLTDANGLATFQLYTAGAFTQGDGVYSIEAKHCGRVIWSRQTALTDSGTIYLPQAPLPQNNAVKSNLAAVY